MKTKMTRKWIRTTLLTAGSALWIFTGNLVAQDPSSGDGQDAAQVRESEKSTQDEDKKVSRKVAKLDRRVKHMAEYFEDLMKDDEAAIPPAILKHAKGIIILRQYKAGLIIGVKGGAGVALARDDAGNWSPPAFLRVGEGSIGLQVGGQSVDSVFILMDEKGMKMLSKPKFQVGVDAAATAGPHGAEAEAKIAPGTSVLVYTNTGGLFVGASFEGGLLFPDNKSNGTYYENHSLTMKEIIFEKKVANTASGKALAELIDQYANPSEE